MTIIYKKMLAIIIEEGQREMEACDTTKPTEITNINSRFIDVGFMTFIEQLK